MVAPHHLVIGCLLQALHWFAGAVLCCMRLRDAHPLDRVAMALPGRPRYRRLTEQVQRCLHSLRLETWFVQEDGVEDDLNGASAAADLP